MTRIKIDRLMCFLLVLLIHAVFCLTVESADSPTGRTFKISVDRQMWEKWGFQYPVTYMFDVQGLKADMKVKRRADPSAGWKVLSPKVPADFFNGDECIRLDYGRGLVFVSVGFDTNNVIELEFENTTSVKFAGVARYYDDRKSAYSLSLDNWGRQAGANPGMPWHGINDDRSDNYQAALCICRKFNLPVSIAINTCMAGSNTMWNTMQDELDRLDFSWEPAVHAQTHPGSAKAYSIRGYNAEILLCRDDIQRNLRKIPWGSRIFEHILTCGYVDELILNTDAREFLFVRAYNGHDNPSSTDYAAWDTQRGFYGIGGLSTKDYDRVFARRNPKGRFFESDVVELNAAFDAVYGAGGIFYAMWHPDRYRNSVIYEQCPGRNGTEGSTLVQHLCHVANRKNVWYVANGWLYSYRYVAEHVSVTTGDPGN